MVFMDFLMGLLDMIGVVDVVLEIEVWKRFQNEGVLDMFFLEWKDCVVLYVCIVVLEVEVKFVSVVLGGFEFV